MTGPVFVDTSVLVYDPNSYLVYSGTGASHQFPVNTVPGEHTVVFEYAPLSFRLGAWITAGTMLLLVAALLAAWLRRRKR